MTRVAALLGGIALVSCTGTPTNELESQATQLASLTFEVPATWHRSDRPDADTATAVWTPEAKANARKESVSIMRSEVAPGVATTTGPTLPNLLVGAQQALRQARPSKVSPATTAQGLAGYRIDVDFVPTGMTKAYHRVHVVLVDDDAALVHVLYTARTPDEGHAALDLVLSTLRRGEASS